MKIITKGGFCSKTNKPLGFQFADQNGGYALGGCFAATAGKVTVSPEGLPAALAVTDAYLARGCKYCGNKYAYVCPNCGMIVCDDGKGSKKAICPSCGSISEIEKARGNNLPKAKLIKRAGLEIAVTSPHYDDIGKILDSLDIEYSAYKKCGYDCNLLFINCGTADKIDSKALRSHVQNGGCVYASDLASGIIQSAFPELFDFKGNCGEVCKIYANVDDRELRDIVGNSIEIEFDLGSWSVLNGAKGTTLLSAANGNKYSGLPIMVKVPLGNGTIFYTCFHNHAQASEKEKALLQLLVLKQLGSTSKRSIEEIGAQMGVDINKIKSKFK